MGRNTRDLQLFVEWFGVTPAQALQAATQPGGVAMGMPHELGLVREGYLADLVLVAGNPLDDITIRQDHDQLMTIMSNGRLHKANRIVAPTGHGDDRADHCPGRDHHAGPNGRRRRAVRSASIPGDSLRCDPVGPLRRPAPLQGHPARRSLMYQANFSDGPPPMSEDCLYLAVWTPDTLPGTNLPVLAWVHGGGNRFGGGSQRIHDGEALVVMLNYRLGALGFLAHPALPAENPAGASGNYTLHDVIAALQWGTGEHRRAGR